MEGVAASAQEFLADGAAVEAALEIDRKRRSALSELRDAFLDFRDGSLDVERLAARIQAPLQAVHTPAEGGPPRNLWGFENEDERRFSERFAQVDARLPEVDLGSVLRTYVAEDAPSDDEERIQQLLAFGEFVASLDAQGGGPRLGVGPAANFLTFAWHCMSSGKEPVFLYASSRTIKAIARTGALGPQRSAPGRELEDRFRTFYRVTRALEQALSGAPKLMRSGWAVEHALAWTLERIQRTQPHAADDGGGRSGVWRPRGEDDRMPVIQAPKPNIRIERPAGSVSIMPPAGVEDHQAADAELQRLVRMDPADLTPASASKRNRFLEISRTRVVQDSDTKMFEKSGVDISEALPPDRVSSDEPFFKVKSPRAREIAQEERKREDAKTEADTRRLRRKLVEERRGQTKAQRPVVEHPALQRPVVEAPRAKEEPAAPEPPPDLPFQEEAPRQEEKTDPGVRLTALLSEFRGEVVQASRGLTERRRTPDRVARDLYLDMALWEDMLSALKQRGSLLMVGPPGVGKTYVARRLGIHRAGHEDRVLFLRLHPELGYEQLIDGPRGPGLVRALCERASDDRERRYVVILDELDRGDAARALGELLGALVERGQAVRLSRSGSAFQVPRNLEVLATARDLPHDPALLGRFPVVHQPADSEVLRRFLSHRRPGFEWVADLHAVLNRRLVEAGAAARQVGQGFLMDPDLDVRRLRGIWRRELLPLLSAQGVDVSGLEYEVLRPG